MKTYFLFLMVLFSVNFGLAQNSELFVDLEKSKLEIELEGLRMWEGKIRLKAFQKELALSQKLINGGCISPNQQAIYEDNINEWMANLKSFELFSDSLKKSFLIGFETLNNFDFKLHEFYSCLLYTSPSPRDATLSRMPSSA